MLRPTQLVQSHIPVVMRIRNGVNHSLKLPATRKSRTSGILLTPAYNTCMASRLYDHALIQKH